LHKALLQVVDELPEVVRVLPQLGILYLEGLSQLVVGGLRRLLLHTVRRVLRPWCAYLPGGTQDGLLGLSKLVLFPEELFQLALEAILLVFGVL
jgi:hypothetical protein